MDILVVLISSLVFGGATSYFAFQRGRDPMYWFVIGMLLGIFGLLLLFILPAAQESEGELIQEEPLKVETKSYEHEWFYLDRSRRQLGPAPFASLKKLWEDKIITAETFVWSEGMEHWRRIGELPDLMEGLEVNPRP